MTLLDHFKLHPLATMVTYPQYESVPITDEYKLHICDEVDIILSDFRGKRDQTLELKMGTYHQPIQVGDIHELDLLIAILAPEDAPVRQTIGTKPTLSNSITHNQNTITDGNRKATTIAQPI